MEIKAITKFLTIATFIILLSLSTYAATNTTSTNVADNAYNWLLKQGSNGGYDKDVFSTAWVALALDKLGDSDNSEKAMDWIFTQQNPAYCFPSGACKVKDTALSALAMEELQESDNLTKVQTWMESAQQTMSATGSWILEITTSSNGTCKLSYTGSNNLTQTKSISVNGGKFTQCKNSYFFDLATCGGLDLSKIAGVKLNVDCSSLTGDKIVTVLYKKSNAFYILSSKTGDKVDITVNNGCYGQVKGGSCHLESSLYSNWALHKLKSKVNIDLYLKANVGKTTVLDNALLYLALKDTTYLKTLKSLQSSDGSWNSNVIDTGLAVFVMADDLSYTTEVKNGISWIKTKQKSDGSFNGKVVDTAVALYTALSTDFSGSTTTVVTNASTKVCNNDGTCDSSLGEDKYNCPKDCTSTTTTNKSSDSSACVVNSICETDYGEDSSNCKKDCYCGDGVCHKTDETATSCPKDCGKTKTPTSNKTTGTKTSYCGDGTCDSDETAKTCTSDCKKKSSILPYVIIVLVIVLVGAGGFLAYKKGLIKLKKGPTPPPKPGYPGMKPPMSRPGMARPAAPRPVQPMRRPVAPPRQPSSLDKSLEEARKLLKKK